MTCPPFTELCAADASTTLGDHLSGCPRCRAIVARVDGSEAALGHAPTPAAPQPAPGPPPEPGGVWTFWAPAMDECVVAAVLESGADEVLIMPLLAETLWASEADIALDPGVLGYAALAPVWASDHVLVEQAVETVSVLSEQHLAAVTAGYDAFYAGGPVADPAGAPVLSDKDPRLGAHAALADDLRPLYSPWSLLHVADELGPVLGQRRDDVGVELEAWSEQLDVEPRVWGAFEAGEADPYTAVPVSVLGQAVRGLGLLRSRRVVELARASVLAHHSEEPVTPAASQARRRRGVVPPRRRDPEAARVAANLYAAALEKELGL
jgi:hypothetical protein